MITSIAYKMKKTKEEKGMKMHYREINRLVKRARTWGYEGSEAETGQKNTKRLYAITFG
jgi:hypothetical protein